MSVFASICLNLISTQNIDDLLHFFDYKEADECFTEKPVPYLKCDSQIYKLNDVKLDDSLTPSTIDTAFAPFVWKRAVIAFCVSKYIEREELDNMKKIFSYPRYFQVKNDVETGVCITQQPTQCNIHKFMELISFVRTNNLPIETYGTCGYLRKYFQRFMLGKLDFAMLKDYAIASNNLSYFIIHHRFATSYNEHDFFHALFHSLNDDKFDDIDQIIDFVAQIVDYFGWHFSKFDKIFGRATVCCFFPLLVKKLHEKEKKMNFRQLKKIFAINGMRNELLLYFYFHGVNQTTLLINQILDEESVQYLNDNKLFDPLNPNEIQRLLKN